MTRGLRPNAMNLRLLANLAVRFRTRQKLAVRNKSYTLQRMEPCGPRSLNHHFLEWPFGGRGTRQRHLPHSSFMRPEGGFESPRSRPTVGKPERGVKTVRVPGCRLTFSPPTFSQVIASWPANRLSSRPRILR